MDKAAFPSHTIPNFHDQHANLIVYILFSAFIGIYFIML